MCGSSFLSDSEPAVAVEKFDVESPLIECEVPSGVVLLADRVGFATSTADKLKIGETVKFNYSSGSENGPRTVLVLKVDYDHIEGLTLERDGEYRSYKRGVNMSNPRIHGKDLYVVVKPFVKQPEVAVVPVAAPASVSGDQRRIRFDEAGAALLASLSGEQLAELYGKYGTVDGINSRFDSATGEVVVDLPKPKVNKFTKVYYKAGNLNSDLTITNKNGDKFELYLYSDGTVGIHNSVNGFDKTDNTPEMLRDQLVKFLA